MLRNPATQKQSVTLQCVDWDENLNLNRVFGHSKWLSLQLNGPLRNYKLNYKNSSRSDAVERNEMKHKTTAWWILEILITKALLFLVSCLSFSSWTQLFYIYSKVTKQNAKVILVFLKGRFNWRLSLSERSRTLLKFDFPLQSMRWNVVACACSAKLHNIEWS